MQRYIRFKVWFVSYDVLEERERSSRARARKGTPSNSFRPRFTQRCFDSIVVSSFSGTQLLLFSCSVHELFKLRSRFGEYKRIIMTREEITNRREDGQRKSKQSGHVLIRAILKQLSTSWHKVQRRIRRKTNS